MDAPISRLGVIAAGPPQDSRPKRAFCPARAVTHDRLGRITMKLRNFQRSLAWHNSCI